MAMKFISQQKFKKCFELWQHRLAKCTAAEVEYPQLAV